MQSKEKLLGSLKILFNTQFIHYSFSKIWSHIPSFLFLTWKNYDVKVLKFHCSALKILIYVRIIFHDT